MTGGAAGKTVAEWVTAVIYAIARTASLSARLESLKEPMNCYKQIEPATLDPSPQFMPIVRWTRLNGSPI